MRPASRHLLAEYFVPALLLLSTWLFQQGVQAKRTRTATATTEKSTPATAIAGPAVDDVYDTPPVDKDTHSFEAQAHASPEVAGPSGMVGNGGPRATDVEESVVDAEPHSFVEEGKTIPGAVALAARGGINASPALRVWLPAAAAAGLHEAPEFSPKQPPAKGNWSRRLLGGVRFPSRPWLHAGRYRALRHAQGIVDVARAQQDDSQWLQRLERQVTSIVDRMLRELAALKQQKSLRPEQALISTEDFAEEVATGIIDPLIEWQSGLTLDRNKFKRALLEQWKDEVMLNLAIIISWGAARAIAETLASHGMRGVLAMAGGPAVYVAMAGWLFVACVFEAVRAAGTKADFGSAPENALAQLAFLLMAGFAFRFPQVGGLNMLATPDQAQLTLKRVLKVVVEQFRAPSVVGKEMTVQLALYGGLKRLLDETLVKPVRAEYDAVVGSTTAEGSEPTNSTAAKASRAALAQAASGVLGPAVVATIQGFGASVVEQKIVSGMSFEALRGVLLRVAIVSSIAQKRAMTSCEPGTVARSGPEGGE